MDLTGKTAIVTGASSGIGAATVRKLREAGVRVAGGARRVERIDADVALELDVTDEAGSAAFVEAAVAELGGVDILFNNAGLALGRAPFTESTVEDEERVVHTNVDGVMRMTRLVLPHIRDEGHIVFMGSIAGRQAYPGGASYIASKFAVRGFSYALREDLLGRPIRITTVDAGLVETRVLGRPLQGRPGGRRQGVRGPRPGHARRGRRLRHVRAHAAPAREPRRDRDQGDRAVVGLARRAPDDAEPLLRASLGVRPADHPLRHPRARRARGRAALRARRHGGRRAPRALSARRARPRGDRALGARACSTSSSTGRRRRWRARREPGRI